MDLEPVDVSRLDVPSRLPDVRRDLHVFVQYVREREVKRSHRNNSLSKADAKRLAKLMSDRDALEEVEREGCAKWIDFVDDLAWKSGFVTYDTKGEYIGYNSAAPSYPDNYIKFKEKPYQQFLRQSAAKQESALLKLMLDSGQDSQSEFFRPAVLGRLDAFDTFGSAVGVVPLLDFAGARRFLLELLAQCPVGQWLSTASLISYLKTRHRYFLIPRKPDFKTSWDAKGGRYGNFRESKERWGTRLAITESDEDSFERVEGRFVERFLEGVPLVLRYVDVAYTPKPSKSLHPSRDCLQAFRVSDRLRRALQGEIAEPKVTVTPAFDVYVQADAYPAGVLSQLEPLCERISDDTTIVLKLTKPKVAAARAADPKLDVVSLLRRLTAAEIPANVVRELTAWSQHGEKFVLYPDGCVLEMDQELPAAAAFTIESAGPGVVLVHSPDKLFDELERQECMPLRVKHGESAFAALPQNARTRFRKKTGAGRQPQAPKRQVSLVRVTRVQLVCPDREFLDQLVRVLAENKCPMEVDRGKSTVSYSQTCESQVSAALRSLKSEYQIKVNDA